MLCALFWDPSRAIFDFPLPLLNRPLLWYGFFFALGFFLGYFVLLSLVQKKRLLADRILVYVIFGAILGARLGDLVFYQNLKIYAQDPWGVLRIWEGGLASHGGVIGALVALFLLSKKKESLPFLSLLDLVAIPAGLVAACIRVGNFFNQEILGTPTDLPWAVIFGHPADGSVPMPRHPVQLYEAFFYLALFTLMLCTRKRAWKPGVRAGLFLVLVFTFRFLIEFLKEEQSALLSSFPLTMGQLLSLPLMAVGVWLLVRKRK